MDTYKLNGTYFYCPVDLTLSIIGGRWRGIVIWNLRDNAMRFSDLKRKLVTINDKMLSQVLKELVETGVVERIDYHTMPPKVEYNLTDEGRQLLPIMRAMSEYGSKHKIGQ